jgi:DNA anti-recombination protein RmuC
MKYLVLLLLLLLCSCAPRFTLGEYIILRDQKAFINAFNDYANEENLDSLVQFVASYPQSEWAERASLIIAIEQKLEQEFEQKIEQIQDLNDKRYTELESSTNRQIADLLTEKAEVQKKVEELTTQIDQLKELLIELEQHPK